MSKKNRDRCLLNSSVIHLARITVMVLLLSGALNSRANAINWKCATTTGTWNNPANWNPAQVPGKGDVVTFNGTSNANCGITGSSATVKSITMEASFNGELMLFETIRVTDTFTLNGGTLTFSGPFNVIIGTLACAGGKIDLEHSVSTITLTGHMNIGASGLLTGATNAYFLFNGSDQTLNDSTAAQEFGIIITTGTSAVTCDSNITCRGLDIKSGSQFTAPDGTLTVKGNFYNEGTFSNNYGLVVFTDLVARTINTGGSNLYNMMIDQGQWTTASYITVDSSMTLESGTFIVTGSTVTVGNSLVYNDGILTIADGSVFNINGAGNLTQSDGWMRLYGVMCLQGICSVASQFSIYDSGYLDVNVLSIQNNGSIDCSDNPLLNLGSFTMSVGQLTCDAGNATMNISGNFSQSGGTFNAENSDINVGGNFTSAGAFSSDTSTITFNGSGAQQLNTGQKLNYLVIDNSSGGVTLMKALSTKYLDISSGTLSMGAFNATISNDMFCSGTGAFSSAGGAQKVTFKRDAGCSSDAYIQTNGSAFNDITLDDNSQGYDFVLLDTLDVDGELIVEDGGLDGNGNGINAAGNFFVKSGADFTAGSKVTFDGGGTQFLAGNSAGFVNFGDIELTGNGTVVRATTSIRLADLTIGATASFRFEVPGTTMSVVAGSTVTNNNNLIMQGDINTSNAVYVIATDTTTGFALANSGSVDFDLVSFRGCKALTSAEAVNGWDAGGNSGIVFRDDVVWNGGTGSWGNAGNWLPGRVPAGEQARATIDSNVTVTLAQNTTVGELALGGSNNAILNLNDFALTISTGVISGDLAISSGGTLNGTGSLIAIAGDWDSTGGVFNAGISTVTFSGAECQYVASGSSAVFNALVINNTTSTVMTDGLNTGRLIISSGTLRAGNNSITITELLRIEAEGSFEKGSGGIIFTGGGTAFIEDLTAGGQNLGSVIISTSTTRVEVSGGRLTVDSLLVGSTAQLSCEVAGTTVTVTNGNIVQVYGTWSVKGADYGAGQMVYIRSDSPGNAFNLVWNSNVTFELASVRDCVALTQLVVSNCVNAGNNTGITFREEVEWSGAIGDWSVAGNWLPSNVPNGPQVEVLIDKAEGAQVTVDGDFTVGSIEIGIGANVCGLILSGDFTVSSSSGLPGSLEVGGNGYLSLEDAHNLSIYGNWDTSGAGAFDAGTSLVTFCGSAAQTVSADNDTFYSVVINKSNNSDTVSWSDSGGATTFEAGFTVTKGSVTMNNRVELHKDISVANGYLITIDSCVFKNGSVHNLTLNNTLISNGIIFDSGGAVYNLNADIQVAGDVIISSGNLITRGNTISFTGDFIIGANGDITNSTGTILLNGSGSTQTLTQSATGIDNWGAVVTTVSVTVDFTNEDFLCDDLTIGAGSVFNAPGSTLTIKGDLYISSCTYVSGKVLIFDGTADQYLTVACEVVFNTMTVTSGYSLFVASAVSTGDISFTGVVDISSGTLDLGTFNRRMIFRDDFRIGTKGGFECSGDVNGAVVFAGSSNWYDSSGTQDFGLVIVLSSATVNCLTRVEASTVTIEDLSTFTAPSSTFTISYGLFIENGGNFNHNNGLVLLDTAVDPFGGVACGGESLNDLEVNSGAQARISGHLYLDGDLLVKSGELTVAWSGWKNGVYYPVPDLYINGDITFEAGIGYTKSTGAIILNGASQAITDNTGSVDFGVVKASGSANVNIVTAIIVDDIVAGVTATLQAPAGVLTVNGNMEIGANAAFIHNSGTVTFSGNANQGLVQAGSVFNNVCVNKTGGSMIPAAGALDINGDLTVNTGTMDLDTNTVLVYLAGNLYNSGTFTGGSGSLVFDGAGSAWTDNTGGQDFGNVITTGPVNVIMTGAPGCRSLTIGAGSSLTAPGTGFLLLGDFINSGTFNAGTGTVIFGGSNNITVDSPDSFNTITIAHAVSTGTVTFINNLDVNAVNITTGTFDCASSSITANVSGNLVVGESGRYSKGLSLIFDGSTQYINDRTGLQNFGDITVSGVLNSSSSLKFSNMIIGAAGAFNCTVGGSSITVVSGSTITVDGSFMLEGPDLATSPIYLVADSGGAPFYILKNGPVSLRSVWLRDCHVNSAVGLINCNDAGGNINVYLLKEMIWDGSADNDWFNADNWDTGEVPGEGFHKAIINIAGTVLLSTDTLRLGELVVGGNGVSLSTLTVNAGIILDASMGYDGDVVITTNGVVNASTNIFTITVEGDWNSSMGVFLSSGTPGCTVKFDGAGAQGFVQNGSLPVNILIDNSNTILNTGEDVDIAGDFSLNAGTVNVDDMIIGGDMSLTGGRPEYCKRRIAYTGVGRP